MPKPIAPKKLLDVYETTRAVADKPISITIHTKVPGKWRFVDLETGDIWRWDNAKKSLVRASDITVVYKG